MGCIRCNICPSRQKSVFTCQERALIIRDLIAFGYLPLNILQISGLEFIAFKRGLRNSHTAWVKYNKIAFLCQGRNNGLVSTYTPFNSLRSRAALQIEDRI